MRLHLGLFVCCLAIGGEARVARADAWEDAKKAFDSYLSRYPRDAWSHLMYGRAQAATGDEAAAMQEYRRALTLEPDLGAAHREERECRTGATS